MPSTDLAADDSDPRAVATCRQTVEAFLTPSQRVRGYDLAADDSGPRAVATCRQTVEAFLTPPQRVPGTNSASRPYMLRISWKSKIPHNL
jgi:hypothetical protein